jgi:hypothetical protein
MVNNFKTRRTLLLDVFALSEVARSSRMFNADDLYGIDETLEETVILLSPFDFSLLLSVLSLADDISNWKGEIVAITECLARVHALSLELNDAS